MIEGWGILISIEQQQKKLSKRLPMMYL